MWCGSGRVSRQRGNLTEIGSLLFTHESYHKRKMNLQLCPKKKMTKEVPPRQKYVINCCNCVETCPSFVSKLITAKIHSGGNFPLWYSDTLLSICGVMEWFSVLNRLSFPQPASLYSQMLGAIWIQHLKDKDDGDDFYFSLLSSNPVKRPKSMC